MMFKNFFSYFFLADPQERPSELPSVDLLRKTWPVAAAPQPLNETISAERQYPVAAESVRHFLALIAKDLLEHPFATTPQEHRALLAGLVGKMSRLNFYELLGLQTNADEQDVLRAFFEVGRLVHPSHSALIRTTGRECVLEFMFEKVVEAYLTLISPRRRASYNLLAGIQNQEQMHPSKHLKERRSRALHYYRQAQHYRSLMDESTACELLRAAVRLDPQPEYLAGLAEVLAQRQGKTNEALELYQRAMDMRPKDALLAMNAAALLEASGRTEQAKEAYRKVLRQTNHHPEAALALRRLEKSRSRRGGVRLAMPTFRTLFQSA